MLSLIEEKQKSLKQIRKFFAQKEGSFSDHIIYLTAFNEWFQLEDKGLRHQFCRKYFISNAAMEVIDGFRRQLHSQLESAGFIGRNTDDHNQWSHHWPTVKASLIAGGYPKLIRFDEQSQQYCNRKERIRFHSSSTLSAEQPVHLLRGRVVRKHMPTQWLIYEELLQMERHSYAKTLTAVTPLTIALFCGSPDFSVDTQVKGQDLMSTQTVLPIDDWISYESSAQSVKIIQFLKQQLRQLFVHRIECLSAQNPRDRDFDDLIVETVVKVLDIEEVKCGFSDSHSLKLRPDLNPSVTQFVPKYEVFLERLENDFI